MYRGGDARKFETVGDGILTVTGDAARLVVKRTSLNTEMSLDFHASTVGNGTISMRSRSNHFVDEGCSDCGYVVTYDPINGEVTIKKETSHNCYTDRILTKSIKLKANDWNNFTTKVYNTENNTKVKVEGYCNGVKVIEAIDDGSWRKYNKSGAELEAILKKCNKTLEDFHKPQLKPALFDYIRMDNAGLLNIRNFTIKEAS